jgi:hypothetical protein
MAFHDVNMSYPYRASAWFSEMLAEAAVFTWIILVMADGSGPVTARDIGAIFVETLTFFCISGYAVTTLVMRLALQGRWLHVYPVIVPLLFLAHFEVMNLLVPEGLMEPHNRFVFRVIGVGVVLVIAGAISLALGRSRKKGLRPRANNV